MKKQRLEGIGKEMMRVISKVLLEEVKNPKIKGLVSVTEVNVTEDLKFADTYFSILPPLNTDEKQYENEEILEALNEIKGFLRKRVAEEAKTGYGAYLVEKEEADTLKEIEKKLKASNTNVVEKVEKNSRKLKGNRKRIRFFKTKNCTI